MRSARPGNQRRRTVAIRAAVALAGLAALVWYLLPGLSEPGAHWPMWDVSVYWWGGQQAVRGAALYAPGARYSFTYPPFAAALFAIAADGAKGVLKAAITAGSTVALLVLCWQSLGAAGVRRQPETVFTVSALALLTRPVGYTLHLGEVNLMVATLVGADLLRRRDAGWWQGVATGIAAGIKLTPLIFIAYLAITRRLRAAAAAAGTFTITVAVGLTVLPAQSRVYWLSGVFWDENRVGNPVNPSNQSLSGAVARLAGNLDAARGWWLAAAFVTALGGLAIACWAHRRGHRLAGVACCAITGLLISPLTWTHHWVWVVPLLIQLAVIAVRLRSGWYGLAAAVTAVVFSGLVPMPWPGHPLSPGRLIQGDLYVLCGLSVLAGAALTLTRETRRRQPDRRLRAAVPAEITSGGGAGSRPGRPPRAGRPR
jgi:alpha-1,2-mannosyltransferase